MSEKRSTEEVPGMAQAIEDRRVELELSPGALAEAAGITRAGLVPVRKGYRRQYQDKVKLGVARALRWEPDAIDRLLKGEKPIPLDDGDQDPTDPGGASAELAELRDELGEVKEQLRVQNELLIAALSGDSSGVNVDELLKGLTHRRQPPPMAGDEGAD